MELQKKDQVEVEDEDSVIPEMQVAEETKLMETNNVVNSDDVHFDCARIDSEDM